jgi:cytoskeletal protein CcmA (bactofilin family)
MPWGIFDQKAQDSGEWSGFLEKGVKLEGKLESPGTLRLDSEVNGAIICDGSLILGENCRARGELAGNSVLIAGQFEGTVRARRNVEIRDKAVVAGDIEAPNILIEPGAIFEGRCHILTARDADKPIIIPIRSAADRRHDQ